MTYREDKSQMRTERAPQVMAALRNAAINPLDLLPEQTDTQIDFLPKVYAEAKRRTATN
jgi:hypothetical protein